jgi:hypothetical protein
MVFRTIQTDQLANARVQGPARRARATLRAFGRVLVVSAVVASLVVVTATSASATITYQTQWGGPQDGQFGPPFYLGPQGVATDSSNNVYGPYATDLGWRGRSLVTW